MVSVGHQTRQAQPHTHLAVPTLLDQLHGSIAAVMHTSVHNSKIIVIVARTVLMSGDFPVQELAACVLVSDARVVQLLHSLLQDNTAAKYAGLINLLKVGDTLHQSLQGSVQKRMTSLLTGWQLSADSSP